MKNNKKRALITCVTGQGDSCFVEFLLKEGCVVYGIKRRASFFNLDRVRHVYQSVHMEDQHFVLHYGDLSDTSNLTREG